MFTFNEEINSTSLPQMIKHLINMSENDVFAVDISGKIFRMPSNYWNRTSVKDCLMYFYNNDIFNGKAYQLPTKEAPVYVKPMNTMVFHNIDSLMDEIKKYGNAKTMVETYNNESNSTYFGVGRNLVNLSETTYYIVENKEIYEVPKCDDTFREMYCNQRNITKAEMQDKDLIVINITIGGDVQTGTKQFINYKDNWICRQKEGCEDPIFIFNDNILVFNNKTAARDFIEKYEGKIFCYLRAVSIEATKEMHMKDMREMANENRQDKIAIAKVATLIAGSGVVTVLAEKVFNKIIEIINGGSEEENKKEAMLSIYKACFNKAGKIKDKSKAIKGLYSLAKANHIIINKVGFFTKIGKAIKTIIKVIKGVFVVDKLRQAFVAGNIVKGILSVACLL